MIYRMQENNKQYVMHNLHENVTVLWVELDNS